MLQSLLQFKRRHKHDVAICCIAKNEGPYLREWIEYHLKIGVSKFFVYDNESQEPIANVLSDYIALGIVNVELVAGFQKQRHAYKQCLANHGKEAKWIAFIDVDEYIVPKTSTNIVEFLTPYERYGGFALSWLVFGSNGHLMKPGRTQYESYTQRSLKTEPINTHIKTIVQPRFVAKVPADPHHFLYKRGKYCVNENFQKVEGSRTPNSTATIQLNHYFLRSLDEFRQKIERGRADGGLLRTIDDFYALDKEANKIKDENILEQLEIIEKTKKGTLLSTAELNR